MGCGSSHPVVKSSTNTLDTKMLESPRPPKLDIAPDIQTASFKDNLDPFVSPSQNDASGSYRDWRDVVSFPTFMTQTDKPQIFEYEFIKSIGRGAQAEVYLVR